MEKDYLVPVTWEVCGFIKVRAQSATEACEKVHANPDEFPLAYSAEYVDGSYDISGEVEEAAAMSEIYTADYEAGKLDIPFEVDDMFVIWRGDINLYCRWNENVILFDTIEEAQEFVDRFPFFFEMATKVAVVRATTDMLESKEGTIRYRDIDEADLRKDQELFDKAQQENEDMRGMLKDE